MIKLYNVKMIDPNTKNIIRIFKDQNEARDYIWSNKRLFNCKFTDKNQITPKIKRCIANNQNCIDNNQEMKYLLYKYIWTSDTKIYVNDMTNLKFGCIYKITNLITNDFYIGKTRLSINKRLNIHFRQSIYNKTHQCRLLYDAMRSYNRESFKIEIIEKDVDINNLNNKENYYIKLLKPKYNILNNITPELEHQMEKLINSGYINKGKQAVADKLKIDVHTVDNLFKYFNISLVAKNRWEQHRINNSFTIIATNIKSGEIIEFQSQYDAAKYISLKINGNEKRIRANINRAIRGDRRSYCGYTWVKKIK